MQLERLASRSSSTDKTKGGGSGSVLDDEIVFAGVRKVEPMVIREPDSSTTEQQSNVTTYRLYKWRFAGVVGIMGLNIVGGMNWPWFGPIANESELHETFLLRSIVKPRFSFPASF